MKHSNMNQNEFSIGLDLGDKKSHYVVMRADERIVATGTVKTTKTAMSRHFSGVPSSRVVIEASTHSAWVSELLDSLGHTAVVANPREVGRKYLSKTKKNDKSDARTLAHLGLVSEFFLAPIKHRSHDARVDLSLIRSRDCLMRVRTELINHTRSIVKGFGERLPKCTTDAFVRKVHPEIPTNLQSALEPILDQIGRITQQIKDYDKKIEGLCKQKYPETEILMQIPGVGYLTALAFVLTLEDPARFRKSRKVGAFLGLVPRQFDSGDSSPQLRITKAGDQYLRRLLVMSAHYILGHFGTDSALRRHGERIVAAGGKAAKKRSVIAVARKLSVLLHHLWLTGEVYEPFPENTLKKKAG